MLHWGGVDDQDLSHGLWPLPQGVSQSADLVAQEKVSQAIPSDDLTASVPIVYEVQTLGSLFYVRSLPCDLGPGLAHGRTG